MTILPSHQTLITICIAAAILGFSALAADEDCDELTSVANICNATPSPKLCYTSLVPKIGRTADPQLIYVQITEAALSEVSKVSLDFAANASIEQLVAEKLPGSALAASALERCRLLLCLVSSNIIDSLSLDGQLITSPESRNKLLRWLSFAHAYLETCEYEFTDLSAEVADVVFDKLKKSSDYTQTSLSIVELIERCAASSKD